MTKNSAMTNTSAIPHIDTATDPISCPDDLHQRWRALMGPLGFGGRLLWFCYVGADRRLHKAVSQVPIGRSPHRDLIAEVMVGLSVALENFEPGTTVAALLSRPGSDPVSADDRRWAGMLADAARAVGIPMEPMFRANDARIVAL